MADNSTLVVDSLTIKDFAGRELVKNVSFSVDEGKVLALIGESGSGKTSVALGLLGFARPGMKIDSGSILVDGENILTLSQKGLRSYRGSKVSNVPQNPTASFSPRMRIGAQVAELLEAHSYPRSKIKSMVIDALESVALPISDVFLKRYPFELSGGQLQRVAIAMALITKPRVVVMDEPTTGLDVSTQETILALVRKLVKNSRASFVYVTHDLAVVDTVADNVAVMYAGEVVELGSREQVFSSPTHSYTKMLLKAVPRLVTVPAERISDAVAVPLVPADVPGARMHPAVPRAAPCCDPTPILEVKGLHAFHGNMQVVCGVSFSILRGECMGLVGGSGSGKTTTGRSITGLHGHAEGALLFKGCRIPWPVAKRTKEDLRAIQIVFQNPDRSLNPRESISQCIGRAVRLNGNLGRREVDGEVARLLDRVRLPSRVWNLYPEDLSGGERQRVAVARALATKPKVMVCDEITSALDVSIQAAVIELLLDLKNDGLSMLFITHNLPLVSKIAESIIIMKDGKIVESGKTEAVLTDPEHEYTQMLLAAAPVLRRT
jgi:peptide/nickel transport system ATP-binding protein